jgi:Tol biopolymer transport system component
MTRVGNPGLWAAILAAVIFAALMLVAGSVHASFPGKNGRIAFTSDRLGDLEIYQMNTDGSHQVNLTRAPSVEDQRASYSADGKRLAYDAGNLGSGQEIYSMRSSGLLQTRLTRNGLFDADPAFSPGGRKISFTSNRITHSTEVFVMNSDGAGVKELTDAPGASFDPSFSPDGTKIAFVSNRDGDSEIFVMNADGSGEHRLTKNTASDDDPDWSPDGTKIAFSTNRTSDFEVFRMSAADTNNDGQGDNPKNLSNTVGQDLDPAYSPNGVRIAFQSNRDGNVEIYVMDATTGNPQTNLSQNDAADFQPAWQPLP